MSCLVHDKRFRSSFHNIINELRKEKSVPVSILHTMPRKCCTCNDENNNTIDSVITKEDNHLIQLKNLTDRVNQEKQTNSRLILSLNRLKNLIKENQLSTSQSPLVQNRKDYSSSFDDDASSPIKHQTESKMMTSSASSDSSSSSSDSSSSSSDSSNSSSDSEDLTPMEISKPVPRLRKKVNRYVSKPNKKIQKSSKPIKNGTFIFLPYATKSKNVRKNFDSLMDVAKTLQRQRFIGRDGHIAKLEKEYDVRINMITHKTGNQVTEALENAKKGLENLTIRNKNESIKISEKQDGEWVLIRSKKPQNQTNATNIEQLLDDLTNRWESCLTIEKRKYDESDDSDDSRPKKK